MQHNPCPWSNWVIWLFNWKKGMTNLRFTGVHPLPEGLDSTAVLVLRCQNQISQAGCLKLQRCIFSLFWSLGNPCASCQQGRSHSGASSLGICCCCSLASVVSHSLRPHGLQHSRLPCPSPSSRVCSNSCPLNQWCHPTISSSVVPFSSCLQSFPASRAFPMCQLFASGGQSIGASPSASVLPMNNQGWFLGFQGDAISLCELFMTLQREADREQTPWCLFYKGINPILGSPTSWPLLILITSQRTISKYHSTGG